jgi:hypothetical protein
LKASFPLHRVYTFSNISWHSFCVIFRLYKFRPQCYTLHALSSARHRIESDSRQNLLLLVNVNKLQTIIINIIFLRKTKSLNYNVQFVGYTIKG